MGYTRFSTANADYALVYADHDKVTHEEIFDKGHIESLDAIVLEDCSSGPFTLEEVKKGIIQYEFIAKAAHAAKKQVFFADVNTTTGGDNAHKKIVIWEAAVGVMLAITAWINTYRIRKKIREQETISRRDFLKTAATGTLGAIILGSGAGAAGSYFFSGEGESTELMPDAGAAFHRIAPTPVIEARNAITARKVEEYVVPALKRKLGRNPNLAVVYGIEHMGLEGCLQHKWWRDAVIGLYKIIDYPGLEKDGLNKVEEAVPADKGGWKIMGMQRETYAYDCGLF